jgi:hypothetical protein
MFLGMGVVEIGWGGVGLVVSSFLMIDLRKLEMERSVESESQLMMIGLNRNRIRNRYLPRSLGKEMTAPRTPLLDLLEYYQVRARGILRM